MKSLKCAAGVAAACSLVLGLSPLATAVDVSGNIYGHTYRMGITYTDPNVGMQHVDVRYEFGITCGGLSGVIAVGSGTNLPVRISVYDKDYMRDDRLATRSYTVFCSQQDAIGGRVHTLKDVFRNVDIGKGKGVLEGKNVELYLRLQIDVPKLRDVDAKTRVVKMMVGRKRRGPAAGVLYISEPNGQRFNLSKYECTSQDPYPCCSKGFGPIPNSQMADFCSNHKGANPTPWGWTLTSGSLVRCPGGGRRGDIKFEDGGHKNRVWCGGPARK